MLRNSPVVMAAEGMISRRQTASWSRKSWTMAFYEGSLPLAVTWKR
jgi:hypothetical protein